MNLKSIKFIFTLLVQFIFLFTTFSCRLSDNKIRGEIGGGSSENIPPASSPNNDTPFELAPSLYTVSTSTKADAYFQANEADHSYFECKVDNNSWFLCSSPFEITNNGANLPPGYTGTFYVRSVNSNGKFTEAVSKSFQIAEFSKGFNDIINGIEQLSDGRKLIFGRFNKYRPNKTKSVALLNHDGTLNYSPIYGLDGTILYDLIYEKETDGSYSGKIIIAGDFTTYRGINVPDKLIRLNSDGTLDTTFNNSGTGFGSNYTPYKLVQELNLSGFPTGKLLVGAGGFSTMTYNGSTVPTGLIRLNQDGTWDNSFNNGGAGAANGSIFEIKYEINSSNNLTGKFFIAGTILNYNGVTKQYLLRIHPDGTLDTSWNSGQFGPDGMTTSVINEINPGTQLPTGKIIVAGNFTNYNFSSIPKRVMRLNSDGSIDTSFNNGNTGGNTVFINQMSLLNELDLAGNVTGKLFLIGHFTTYNGNAVGKILKLNADGTFDSSFNSGGTGFTPSASNILPSGILNQINSSGQLTGKLFIGGQFSNYNSNQITKNLIVIDDQSGMIDSNYNTNKESFDSTVQKLVYHRNSDGTLSGKVWAIGGFNLYGGDDVPAGIAILKTDGTLDTTFNGGTGFTRDSNTMDILSAIEERNSSGNLTGKIIVTGTFNKFNGVDIPDGIIRLHLDGSIDSTFNNSGIGVATLNQIKAIQEFNTSGDPTEKIFLYGSFNQYNGVSVPFGLIRLNSNGTYDSSFNSGGISGSIPYIHKLLQVKDNLTNLPNGKILVGGQFSQYNSLSVPQHLIQLNADGTFDSSFNNGGSGFVGSNADVYFIEQELDTATGLPTGKIITGGDTVTQYNGTAIPIGIIRLNANGTLDSSFNSLGSGSSGFIFNAKQIRGSNQLPTGDWIVTGSFTSFNGNSNYYGVVVLDQNGDPKNTFNGGVKGFITSNILIGDQLKNSSGQFLDQFFFGGSFSMYNNEWRPYGFVTNEAGAVDEFLLGNGQ